MRGDVSREEGAGAAEMRGAVAGCWGIPQMSWGRRCEAG